MPKGFQKGNKLSSGRRGYELEKKQLDLMRKIVSRDLRVVEKIYSGKANEKDFKKLAALQVRVAKYLDKLHAQRTDITSGGEQIIPSPLLINVHRDNSITKDTESEEED